MPWRRRVLLGFRVGVLESGRVALGSVSGVAEKLLSVVANEFKRRIGSAMDMIHVMVFMPFDNLRTLEDLHQNICMKVPVFSHVYYLHRWIGAIVP